MTYEVFIIYVIHIAITKISSGRVGWIPPADEISPSLARDYGWIKNASVTEMEIIHGAIRKYNPNGNSNIPALLVFQSLLI